MSERALRVLLVDDEALARSRLKTLLGSCTEPPAEVAGEAGRASEALQWLSGGGASRCDLVLLDIQMPGLDGLGLAKALLDQGGPAVVFVTAHAEHALQAFEIEAIDYLTKPVRQERLQSALARAASRLARTQPTTPDAGPAAGPDAIVVNDRGRVVRVPLDEVLYLKAELKYVTVRTAERTWLIDESLSELEPRLASRFVRVHRNALVARRAIRRLERRLLPNERSTSEESAGGSDVVEAWAVQVLPVDEWVMVSRRQLAGVREALSADPPALP